MLRRFWFWKPMPVLALLLAVLILPWTGTRAIAPLDAEEQAFVGLINQYRAANGLAPLSVDPHLQDAARWMSNDMAGKDYLSHYDSLGRDPFQRMAAFGYTYDVIKGENLAAGVGTAQAAFDLWLSSPDHKAMMLHPDFRGIGIARAYSAAGSYGWYWTMDLGGYVAATTPGDADCNGAIDSTDALAILRTVTGLSSPLTCSNLDADCNGVVDAADALAILRYVAGLSTTLPACP